MSDEELSGFIRGTFRSVWTLELLCYLREHGDRAWSRADLVRGLRASDAIVANGIEALLAAGLVIVEGDGSARHQPASPDLDRLAERTQALYRQRPDAVRRLIVDPTEDAVSAFAQAFRLRRD